MSFLDKAKQAAEQARDKAEDVAREHGDTIKRGVDKAADAADSRTGGAYRDQVERARAKAGETVDELARQGEEGAPPRRDHLR
jgi:hypothetical protein